MHKVRVYAGIVILVGLYGILNKYNSWQNRNDSEQTIELPKSLVASFDREILKAEDISVLSERELDDYLHSFVNQLDTKCSEHIRLGKVRDGGWDMCLDGRLKPTKNSCLVYSFGIGNDWTFDDAVDFTYGCKVKAYDPSLGEVENHNRTKNIEFFPIGLGGTERKSLFGRPVITFGQMLKDNNHHGELIDMLKMDIETSEWTALEAMFADNSLQNVKQIGIEVHFGTKVVEKNVYTRFINILRKLQSLGFEKWDAEPNYTSYWYNWNRPVDTPRWGCWNLAYINKRFL